MERFITRKLIEWKNKPNRKPLIVRGARQTGKSYTLTSFGKTHFEGTVHIVNFEKRIDWHDVFKPNLDASRIVNELEILLGSRIEQGKDLLFFDEIQECPEAIQSLRYFYEQLPGLHIVAAGSLLEFALSDIAFPVGRVQLLNMYPMTFAEYLLATNKSSAADLIRDEVKQLSDPIHKMLNDELKKYMFIGGMPECVKTYAETNKLSDVSEVQTDLIATFRQDFGKYAGKADKTCLNSVLLSIPQLIGNQIKYTALAEGFTTPTIRKAFELLETARLIKKNKSTSPAGIPLGSSASEKKFKAIMLDTGLLSCLSGMNLAQEFQKQNLLSVFRGNLAEQFVGQEIIATTDSDLYYWSREAKNSNAETDYLIEKNGDIIPVEVKSGSSGSLKSLHLLMSKYPDIKTSYVFSDARYRTIPEQKLTFIPLYFTGSACINALK